MQTLVVGLNHKTAPVGLLERLTIQPRELPKALHQLGGYEHVLEGAILSTCNRTEIYAVVSRFHGGVQDLRNFLAEFCHLAPEEFVDHLYTYHDEAAIRHLFRVVTGIDSMVLGESEIVAQVRAAFAAATDAGVARTVLGDAFRHALHTGKRARRDTAIGRNPASVSTAAVELARRALGAPDLSGRRVVVVGAGKMGELAARALDGSGAAAVVVVNRSDDRGHALARRFGAAFLPLQRLEDALVPADIVLSSTDSARPVISADVVGAALARRQPGRPLLFVDIAVPRDVDAEVASLPGVVVRDIDDLRSVVESSLGSRMQEVAAVEAIVSEELERFVAARRASEAGPRLAALAAWGEEVRRRELERVAGALRGLDGEQTRAVEDATRRIVAKLLHEPLRAARELAARGHTSHLEALQELFGPDR